MEVQKSSSSVPIHDDGRKKHCWECRRRRLVCDSAQPTCNRCRQARIVCPGYEDHQPLRWLTPGKVTSRSRRPKGSKASKAKAANASAKKSIQEEGDPEEGFEVQGISKSQLVDTLLRFELKYTIDMYESSSPLKGMVRDDRLGLPPVSLWRYLPQALKYMFVSLAMAHHINRLPPGTDRSSVSAAMTVLWHWNGLAIRALNELINQERFRVGDAIIAGTLLIMACDLQQNIDSQWRHHYDGLTRMIELRGGMLKYWQEAPHMRTSVAGLVITEAFANSTSPYNDQFTRLTRAPQLDDVRTVLGDGVYPAYIGTLCPPELILLIIRVNHLRASVGSSLASPCPPTSTSVADAASSDSGSGIGIGSGDGESAALDLLAAILAFSPAQSASRTGLLAPDEWILFGRIYQSAAVLYCVVSLRSVGLLPPSSTIPPSSSLFPLSSPAAIEATHYDRLLPDLKRALDAKPQNKSPLLWPLAVAGTRAKRGSSFERGFIEDTVREVGRHTGSVVAWSAAGALRRYWDAGGEEDRWDECWDRAFCLLA
ncbi:fungal-specific transcription factor domain-containing protein [Camillea tinctor]|nr:fungal-specific transcription factor domain-containing protein [Camillea tinctor]